MTMFSGHAAGAFWIVLRYEGSLLWRDRSLPIAVALLTLLLGGGLYNGLLQVGQKDALLETLQQEQGRRFAELNEELKKIEAGQRPDIYRNPATPLQLLSGLGESYAIMPSVAPAPLALGQSDILPSYLQVSSRSEIDFVYDADIENPWRLSVGHFDAAFVIVYLLPLLIFGLGYNLLSAEREQGTLWLLSAQPVSLVTIVLGKAATRAVAFAAPISILPLAALMLFRPSSEESRVLVASLVWSGLACAYGLFWLSVAVVVNSLGRSSAHNAIALVGAWVVLVLVAPLALDLAVDVIRPTATRIDMVERLHRANDAAARRFADLDRTDYDARRDPRPKNGKVTIQPTTFRHLYMQKDVSETMEPWMKEFEEQLDRRQELVDSFRFLSPAATTSEAMSEIAGANLTRFRRLQRLASDFYRQRLAFALPKILSGSPLTEADLRSAPSFVWTEEQSDSTTWRRIASFLEILIPAAIIFTFGLARVNNFTRESMALQ